MRDCRRRVNRGFTLVELLLVMAMLTAILALSLPSLSTFFRGRMLNEEARRFIALTRYGQNQAISLEVPMQLWIDVEKSEYGLAPLPGYELIDTKPVRFRVANDLRFEITEPVDPKNGKAIITFLPDGSVGEGSLCVITIVNTKNEWLKIQKNDFRSGYEINRTESNANQEKIG